MNRRYQTLLLFAVILMIYACASVRNGNKPALGKPLETDGYYSDKLPARGGKVDGGLALSGEADGFHRCDLQRFRGRICILLVIYELSAGIGRTGRFGASAFDDSVFVRVSGIYS